MKKNGSKCEFGDARDAALMRAFRAVVSRCALVRLPDVSMLVVLEPCERFWVSEERATVVVSAMMRDASAFASMLPSKRRMFCEILRRVVQLKAQRPRSSLFQLVSEVVNSPAPEFYMSPRYVRDRLEALRRERNNR